MFDLDTQLLEVDDPRWPALLSRVRHDLDHRPEYLAIVDTQRGTTTRLFVVDDGEHALLAPLVFTPLDGGHFDATSPQPRAAPVFSEDASEEWKQDAIASMMESLREMGVVSLFMRLHPLLDSAATGFGRLGAVVVHGPNYAIALDRPLEEIRRSMRRNHRRGIRRAEQEGIHVVRDEAWENLEEYHQLYSTTMSRVGAGAEYLHSRQHFEEMRDVLGDHVSLWIMKIDDEVVDGHLVTEYDGIVQSLYGGRHPDHHSSFSQIVIYDTILQWAHERGARYYFFDGGAQEGLRHFKDGITNFHPLASSARIIVDPVYFGRCCSEWESRFGRRVTRADAFFPPYRQIPEFVS